VRERRTQSTQAAGPQLKPGPPPGGQWERDEVRVSLRRLLTLMAPAWRLVWRASPKETIGLLAMQTLSGLALPAQVLAGKWALDSILAASRSDSGMQAALPAVVVALAAMTAGQVLVAVARNRQRLLPELAAQTAQEMLIQKAVSLDLEALETPAFKTGSCARSTRRCGVPRTWSATWPGSSAPRSRSSAWRACCSWSIRCSFSGWRSPWCR